MREDTIRALEKIIRYSSEYSVRKNVVISPLNSTKAIRQIATAIYDAIYLELPKEKVFRDISCEEWMDECSGWSANENYDYGHSHGFNNCLAEITKDKVLRVR